MNNILVISSRLPYPLVGGDRIRIFNFGKYLSRYHNLDLLALHEGALDPDMIEQVQKVFRHVIVFPYPRLRYSLNAIRGLLQGEALQVAYYKFAAVNSWLDQHLSEYDGIIVNHIRMSPYIENRVIPKWIDLHDAISFNYSEALTKSIGFWKLIYQYEKSRVQNCERKATQQYQKAFIVSGRDKEFLVHQGCDPNKIIVAPVAVSNALLEKKYEEDKTDTICFIGKMDTVANVDAACYFARDIFPLIRRERSNARFLIVGAAPTRRVRDLSALPGVEVTGWVEDPYAILGKSKVVVAPMRIGAGMQNKILEAMALGKTVVTTPIAADGIRAITGEHYLVAKNIDNYAETVVQLFDDEKKRQAVGEKARQWVQDHHTWSIIGEIFSREMKFS